MSPTDPRRRPSAHRPLRAPARGKRALTHVGGPIDSAGDPALARAIAAAFSVQAGERDATLTHPFHAYPARLHPEIARILVAQARVRCGPGGVVLDPCCGSGTVLVEAAAAGLAAVGTDLSPLAVELAAIKTRVTTELERKAIVECAHEIARQAAARVRARSHDAVPRGEREWFLPHTLAEVAALSALVDRTEPGLLRDAMRMLLSSILVKVSLQSSDSDARRVPKPVERGAAPHFFARKSLELSRCLAAFARAVPRGTPAARVLEDDATRLAGVLDASVDAVVTSPPYANTYDYVDHHARRYAWLGMDARSMLDREIGAARWFDVPEAGTVRFARELGSMCAAFARVLRPGGAAFVIMADGAAAGVALRADEAMDAAARGAGLRVLARASQARPVFDAESARAFARKPKREHLFALGLPR